MAAARNRCSMNPDCFVTRQLRPPLRPTAKTGSTSTQRRHCRNNNIMVLAILALVAIFSPSIATVYLLDALSIVLPSLILHLDIWARILMRDKRCGSCSNKHQIKAAASAAAAETVAQALAAARVTERSSGIFVVCCCCCCCCCLLLILVLLQP